MMAPVLTDRDEPKDGSSDEGAQPGPGGGDSAAALEAGWEKLLSEWDDPEAHRRFVGLAVALNALPDAGARYRAIEKARPERAEAARRGMEKIFAVALNQMELTRTEPQKPPRLALFLLALLVSAALVGTALWAYLG